MADNVHRCIDKMGKSTVAHAVRLKYYEGPDFVITEDIKKLYVFHTGSFEDNQYLNVRLKNNQYQILVEWLGLDKPSWESYDYHLDLFRNEVRQFLAETRNANELAGYLYSIEFAVEVAGVETSLTAPIYEVNAVIEYPGFLALPCDNKSKHLSRSPGWTPAEDVVLQCLIYGFGIGAWDEILAAKRLPGKTKSQIVFHVMKTTWRSTNRSLPWNETRFGSNERLEFYERRQKTKRNSKL